MSYSFVDSVTQLAAGVREVDRRHEWLQRQTWRRYERGEHLADVTQCLQNDASMRVKLQQDLLRCALTRRGLRALRATTHCKRTYIHCRITPSASSVFSGHIVVHGTVLWRPIEISWQHVQLERPSELWHLDFWSELSVSLKFQIAIARPLPLCTRIVHPTPCSFTSSFRTTSTDLCLDRFFLGTRFLILFFSYFFCFWAVC